MSFVFKSITEDAPLKIWEEPQKGIRYSMGWDTSTGLGMDWSVGCVLSNMPPFQQVAVARMKWSVVEVGEFANKLGRYYNIAMACIETNYPGNAVQDALIQVYKYPRNYQAEQHLDEAPNISSKYGFTTTPASKWMLIRELQSALKDGSIILNDPTTIEELMNYVYIEDKSKTGAAEGLNDDCVMALMLAYHAAMLWPQTPKKRLPKPISEEARQHREMMNAFHEKLMNRRFGEQKIKVL
jgi:hypothetical protein